MADDNRPVDMEKRYEEAAERFADESRTAREKWQRLRQDASAYREEKQRLSEYARSGSYWEEKKLLAEYARDMAEVYPTEEERMRWLPRPAQPPEDAQERAQYFDLVEMYPDWGESLQKHQKEQEALRSAVLRKEGLTDVTPEQQASVNKALVDTSISKDIGGASDVGGKPVPNDPTPIEKSRDIGQDLHKTGVTMDKE